MRCAADKTAAFSVMIMIIIYSESSKMINNYALYTLQNSDKTPNGIHIYKRGTFRRTIIIHNTI